MTTILQDLRYGIRMLRRSPGFTLAVVITLAIGIGANTVLFSVVHGVLLRPLPYADPSRLALMGHENLKEGIAEDWMAYDTFLDVREQSESFESIAGFSPSWTLTLEGREGPERIEAHWVSHGFFETLGVAPRLGRSFAPEEDRRGEPMSIILSHKLFESRFDSDEAIVGKTITIDDAPARVVGVMPAGFRFLEEVDAWVPLALNGVGARGRAVRWVKAVARLRSDTTLDAARSEARTIASRLGERYPDSNNGLSASLSGLHERIAGPARGALLILMGVVGFVLLIACANVASLLTSRAAARGNEVAVRAALGAGRSRLVRQFLTESVILALAGGAAGLALAVWGVDLIRAAGPADLPRREELAIDPTVLVFTLIASLGTGILFGISPALQITRARGGALQAAGRWSLGTHGSRTRRVLVVTEVALAFVLLIGAGLMVRSFARLLAVDPGFSTGDVLTLKVALPGSLDTQGRRNFYQQMHQRVGALPGVRAAGGVTRLPLSSSITTKLEIEGRPIPAGQLPEVEFRRASPGYFEAMEIPLLSGRSFATTDDAQAPPVLLVNRAAAHRFWPGQDPVGRRARTSSSGDSPWFTIIGVVGDVKHFGLDKEAPAEVYMAFDQNPPSSPQIAIRVAGDPRALIAPVRTALKEIEPRAVIFDVAPIADRVSASLATRRFNLVMLGAFAGIALLLAAVGIYGVLSYTVRQRTREIGVRMALGASRGSILGLVLSQGMTLVAVGLLLGLAGALALTRLMTSILFDIAPTDPATFLIAPPFLAGVALLACWLPALRAARVDPMEALRYE